MLYGNAYRFSFVQARARRLRNAVYTQLLMFTDGCGGVLLLPVIGIQPFLIAVCPSRVYTRVCYRAPGVGTLGTHGANYIDTTFYISNSAKAVPKNHDQQRERETKKHKRIGGRKNGVSFTRRDNRASLYIYIYTTIRNDYITIVSRYNIAVHNIIISELFCCHYIFPNT